MVRLRTNFWIEQNGEVVLSSWRVKLLEAIAETGSISAAASKMNISYRRAWDKIHECEQRLGVKLVETQTGGVGGGGAKLTVTATDYIARFRQLTTGLQDLAERRFNQFFADWQEE